MSSSPPPPPLEYAFSLDDNYEPFPKQLFSKFNRKELGEGTNRGKGWSQDGGRTHGEEISSRSRERGKVCQRSNQRGETLIETHDDRISLVSYRPNRNELSGFRDKTTEWNAKEKFLRAFRFSTTDYNRCI